MASIKHLNDENFEATITNGKVLIDFSAEWCGPCKMMLPILESLAKEMEGKISVYKVDVDAAQKVTSKFDITSVPTLILFENGQEKKRIVGLKDLATLKSQVS